MSGCYGYSKTVNVRYETTHEQLANASQAYSLVVDAAY